MSITDDIEHKRAECNRLKQELSLLQNQLSSHSNTVQQLQAQMQKYEYNTQVLKNEMEHHRNITIQIQNQKEEVNKQSSLYDYSGLPAQRT